MLLWAAKEPAWNPARAINVLTSTPKASARSAQQSSYGPRTLCTLWPILTYIERREPVMQCTEARARREDGGEDGGEGQ